MEVMLILVLVLAGAFLAGYSLLDTLLNSKGYEERVIHSLGGRKVSQVNNYISVEQLYLITVTATASLFILGLLIGQGNIVGGIFFGIVLGIFGLFIPSLTVSYFVSKRLETINRELPGVLELISSSVHAGLTLNQAIERNLERMPRVLATEFRIIMNECRLGTSLIDALKHWSERIALMDVKLVVVASELSLRHGGNLAETYRNLSRTIRERFMFQQEVETLTTEGRMQAVIMTLLPFVILVILTLIRRAEMLQFLSSGIGIASVLIVLLMQLTAYFWIRKVMEIDI